MMTVKLIGALCIVIACGGAGYTMAAAHRREENGLRQLIGVLDFMGCELQYRLTPLPELFRFAAGEVHGALGQILLVLTEAMETRQSDDASECMRLALEKGNRLSPRVRKNLVALGTTLGRFDLPGQMQGIESVRQQCRRELDELEQNRDVRLRSYQTLGLCAGFALAILFL